MPPATLIAPPERLATTFRELIDRWRAETMFPLSTTAIATHPAYQRIIGPGPQVIPLILGELTRQSGHWFWALAVPTGDDPVPPADRGNLPAMTAAWVNWGRENGWIA